MKKIKYLLLVLFFMLAMLTSCASAPMDGDYAGSYGDSYKDSSSGDIPANPGEDDMAPQLQPGQLTVAAYDDNEHYEFWNGLATSTQEGEGLFSKYHTDFTFKTLNRIKITVPKEVQTKVYLLDNLQANDIQSVLFIGQSDASGVCYLYAPEKAESYRICLEYYQNNETEPVRYYDTITGDTEYNLTGISKEQEIIQIMFVIDATGSMGDELEYIKVEVTDIMSQVEEAFQNTKLELAVMVYRDYADSYVTKYSDFTTDFSSQKSFLNKQSASGGGDFEEAVHTALAEAAGKQWRQFAKTKILFHIADAPSHNEDVTAWKRAVHTLAEQGVHIITVASSGIDKKTEYFFRSQSILTNGKYVYLTNDSGIGGDHLEATVEERPVVEFLNACLVRLIKGYHTGTFEEPVHWQQVVKQEQNEQQ